MKRFTLAVVLVLLTSACVKATPFEPGLCDFVVSDTIPTVPEISACPSASVQTTAGGARVR